MRISSHQLNQQGINRILEMYQQTAKTQQQLATGRRIASAADDPVASVRINSISEEISLREQFRKIIDLAESDLKLEESTLDHMVGVLQRVRELTVQSGNAINTPDDRRFISAEIQSRFEELMSLMNTRLASGDYLFAGFRGGEIPFVQNTTGSIVYQGDEGQRVVHELTPAPASICLSECLDCTHQRRIGALLQVIGGQAHLMSDVQRDQGDVDTGCHDNSGRVRVHVDIELGGRGDISRFVDGATHDNQPADTPHGLGVTQDGPRNVGERTQSDNA